MLPEYQLCPKCNGQGIVSKPPYVPDGVDNWTSNATSYTCNVCNGAKIIPRPTGFNDRLLIYDNKTEEQNKEN